MRALNDALDLSQAEFGQLALQPSSVFLRDVMDGVQECWQARAAADGVTLLVAYDGEPDLNATLDAGRMRQVFDKLIEAAIADGAGGAVEASLRAVRAPGGLKLEGRVRGGGGGLAALHLAEALATPAKGPAQDDISAGLGLALCQRILSRMGGSLRVDDNVGASATIAFELEAPETVAPRPRAWARSRDRGRRPYPGGGRQRHKPHGGRGPVRNVRLHLGMRRGRSRGG